MTPGSTVRPVIGCSPQICHDMHLLRSSITYIHIYEDPTVSIGIFCLPKGAQLPLHNHPGMTVLSR